MQAGRIAHVEQEADDYRLIVIAAEEVDFLFFALIEYPEIVDIQVGDEPTFFVGDGYGDDDFVDLDFDAVVWGFFLRGCRVEGKE